VTALAAIPTVLVSGERGAGKTTLLSRLLAARPPAERRAVLLTERGEAVLPRLAEVAVAEAEPGCVCCVGQVGLRVALTRLLRDSRPERLYVELTEPSHLGAALKTLGNPWLAPVIRVESVIGVADASRLSRDAATGAWLAHLTELHVRGDADGAVAAFVRAERPGLALR
jgi:G3E family GTPase